jgi:Tfp pilus assembly protein PilW
MTRGGSTVVELLVASTLALVVLTALTAAIGAGNRLLASVGARGQAEDIAQLALEALVFDVRRAGYDPAGAGIAPVGEAHPDRLTLAADLDGDGTVATDSEETTTYACALAARRLSRIIGRQSLPLADGVTACAFRFLDAGGDPIPLAAGGLDGADRDRIRAIGFDLTLIPPGGGAPTARRVTVALRSRP